MKTTETKPKCVFCGASGAGAQFAIFNPRFKPFGTACVECEATLPEGTKVPETQPEEPAKPQSWQASKDNPPGPIQVNRFNKANNKIRQEHDTRRELWGVIGGEEHDMSYYSVFGGGRREDVAKVQAEIGERYGWTVTKANVNAIIADMEAALPALQAARPVDDKRKTKEQDEAEKAAMKAREIERKELEVAFKDTAPGFQATIKRLSDATNKCRFWIFSLWRKYSAECQSADQSAVYSEFVQWYQKDLGVPLAKLEQAIAEPKYTPLGTVAFNRTHNGVEIAFTDKPSDELRYRLQRGGFRITRRPPWKWYQKYSETAWHRAIELAGVNPSTCPLPGGSGPDHFDMAVEDQMAEAAGVGGYGPRD